MSSHPASATRSDTPVISAGSSLMARGFFGALADMKVGQMQVELPDGEIRVFGDTAAISRSVAPGVSNTASIRIRRPAFFKKCVLGGDIGFAESYMDGDWVTPDLTAVIGWFILNIDHAPTLSGSKRAKLVFTNLLRSVNRFGHLLRPNSRNIARQNIREHYDLSNDFFGLWLDETMMYSAGRWATPETSLEQAQFAKNDALCKKLQLKATDHVLEIGTGWGGWSIHAAQHYGCRVTTVTISQQQHDLAVKRIASAGLGDRIDVRMQDYRDITGTFDKIVSIEMLEAVGHQYLPEYATACHRLLKRDGLLALQYITYPDSRYHQLRRGVDFIQKHIFPGSLLLSVNRMNHLLSEHGDFVLNHLEDFGRDYAITLRAWRAGFDQKVEQVRALRFDDRFIRKWHYYLAYCEAAFDLRNISVVQTVHTRPNNLSL